MRLTFSYLKRLPVFGFLYTIRIIINRMAKAPSLVPNPNPPLSEMEEAWAAAKEAANNAMNGDRILVKIRKEKFEILLNMTIQQGGYVSNVCKTAMQAESLGFRVAA